MALESTMLCWADVLVIGKPDTVVRWHRASFRLFWRWKSRSRGPAESDVAAELKTLIRQMADANVGWGAPRIHGELLKLGIDIGEREFPSARWTGQQIIEAFPEDTAPNYIIRDRDGIYGEQFRCRVEGIGIEEVPTAPRSPWQNPYAERLVGRMKAWRGTVLRGLPNLGLVRMIGSVHQHDGLDVQIGERTNVQ